MTMSSKVLSHLEACFDLVSSPSMKIQLMGGKITENFGLSRRGFVCSLNQSPKGSFYKPSRYTLGQAQIITHCLEIFTGNKVQIYPRHQLLKMGPHVEFVSTSLQGSFFKKLIWFLDFFSKQKFWL